MTRKDTLASLAVNAWINRGWVVWPGANLHIADLYGANLHSADLHGADLSRADLSRTNLYGADLSDADLHGANLRGANLSDANLTGADLIGANLSRADMYGADLSDANLSGANPRGAYLRGANLSGANLRGDTLAAHVTSADRGDYEFRLFRLADGSHKVQAGCRWMTVDNYAAHVAREYPDTPKARRALAILDYFESVIQLESRK